MDELWNGWRNDGLIGVELVMEWSDGYMDEQMNRLIGGETIYMPISTEGTGMSTTRPND